LPVTGRAIKNLVGAKKERAARGGPFMFGGGGGNARRCAPRPSLMLRTGVTALRRPALACGSLVEPGTRALIHTDSQNAEGPPKGDPSSFGGGGGNRTRVREPSAPGSTCLSASIDLTERYPTGREDVRRSRMGFNRSTPGELHGELVSDDAWDLNAQARLQPDGTLLGFKQRVRSCRRWQL